MSCCLLLGGFSWVLMWCKPAILCRGQVWKLVWWCGLSWRAGLHGANNLVFPNSGRNGFHLDTRNQTAWRLSLLGWPGDFSSSLVCCLTCHICSWYLLVYCCSVALLCAESMPSRTALCPAAEDLAEVVPCDFNRNKSAHAAADRYWEEIGLQSKQWIQTTVATFLDIHHCHMARRLHESDHSMSWPQTRLLAPRNGSNMFPDDRRITTSCPAQPGHCKRIDHSTRETTWTLLLQHIVQHLFRRWPKLCGFKISRSLKEDTTSKGNPT